MRTLRFRKPVICQNGHKAFWYYEISNKGIAEIFNRGVPREVYANVCDCPKFSIGEGWTENGDDEQMTGLKDKNGVEIYEGDIVRDAQNGDTDEVVWNEKYAAFQVRDVEQPWHGNLNGSFFKARTEVIGNIYENKELLEDNND